MQPGQNLFSIRMCIMHPGATCLNLFSCKNVHYAPRCTWRKLLSYKESKEYAPGYNEAKTYFPSELYIMHSGVWANVIRKLCMTWTQHQIHGVWKFKASYHTHESLLLHGLLWLMIACARFSMSWISVIDLWNHPTQLVKKKEHFTSGCFSCDCTRIVEWRAAN